MSKKEKPRRKRGRPTLKEGLDRQFVLGIAQKVFSEKGFSGAKLSDIAQEASISKSLINYHFKSKEQLWKEAVLDLGNSLFDQLNQATIMLKDLKGPSLLKAINRQFIHFSAEKPELYRIICREMCAKGDRCEWLTTHILKPMHEIFEPILSNVYKDLPMANFISIIIGAANVFFFHSIQLKNTYGIDVFSQNEIEKHADFVNELIFPKP